MDGMDIWNLLSLVDMPAGRLEQIPGQSAEGVIRGKRRGEGD
jgi:hypothetical protein